MHDPEQALKALQAENTQLRRAVDELSILNELASAIGASREVEDVIQTIIRRSLSSVRAEQGVVTMVGEEVSDPTVTLVRTMASSGQSEALSPDQSLLGWMHINKRPLLLNEPRTDDRFKGVRWPDQVRSILCVPMIAQSRLVGILTLYNKKLPAAGFTPGDQRLIAILASQSAQVVESARLYKEERLLLEMQQEYRLANEIQTNLLPSTPPQLDGYDLAGVSLPAQEVGGDYFDYIQMNDGRLALTVGDVSGKGVPAALLMASTQGTLRGQVVPGEDPSSALENTNRLLCDVARKGTFVTLFLGMLDAGTHRLAYANAGHNRPFVVREGGEIEILQTGSLVLGFMPSHRYEPDETKLNKGDVLVIYSDGVTEAMNEDSAQFDEDRLYELASRHRHESARSLMDRVIGEVRSFAGGRAQSDDITLVIAQRTA